LPLVRLGRLAYRRAHRVIGVPEKIRVRGTVVTGTIEFAG